MKRKINKNYNLKKLSLNYKFSRLEKYLAISAVVLAVIRFLILPLVLSDGVYVPVSSNKTEQIRTVVKTLCDDFYINNTLHSFQGKEWSVKVPVKFRLIPFYASLQSELIKIDTDIINCTEKSNKNVVLTLGDDKGKIVRLSLIKNEKLHDVVGRVAIIIDDFGYNYNDVTKSFLFFEVPLTIAILPGLSHSQVIARDAGLANKDVLVHMPMEPLEAEIHDDGFTLLTTQESGIIRLRIKKAMAAIPNAVGMNNHQGSKATTDARLLNTLFIELHSQNKFFIDSRTNSKSIALTVARQNNVPARANQLFLDAKDDDEFIKSQIVRMADLARKNGSVIAIGHDREKTNKILEEMLPPLQARGIEFVGVSELLK